MNRREAIAALMSLPSVARIQVAALKPGDVIVIESNERLSVDTVKRLQDACKSIWPDQKVAILDQGLKLKVVSG